MPGCVVNKRETTRSEKTTPYLSEYYAMLGFCGPLLRNQQQVAYNYYYWLARRRGSARLVQPLGDSCVCRRNNVKARAMRSVFVVESFVCTLACVVAVIVFICSLYIRLSPHYTIATQRNIVDTPNRTSSSVSRYHDDGTGQSRGTEVVMNYNKSHGYAVANLTASSVEPTLQASNSSTVKPTLQASSTSSTCHGYLIAVNLLQQLNGATHGYLDLATLGALLQLSVVVPYIQGTILVGVPASGTAPGSLMKLSTLYDFESLRATVGSCLPGSNQTLLSFETFLKQSSRNVVVVYVMASSNSFFKSTFSNIKQKITEIDSGAKLAQKLLKQLNEWAAYVSKQNNMESTPFVISHVLAIDARPKLALHLQELTETLGSIVCEESSKSGSVTVLFDEWRAIHTKPDTGFFYYIPEFKGSCSNLHDMVHSQTVINTSLDFAHSINDSLTHPRVGVHIRGERIFEDYHSNFVKCFKELQTILNKLISSAPDTQVRVIHDMGKYGTKSCNEFCQSQRPKLLSLIKDLGHRVVSFQPDKFPSVPNHLSFVACVEREYLSRMDELVTVGSGGFSNSIASRFLHHSGRSKDKLHRICNN